MQGPLFFHFILSLSLFLLLLLFLFYAARKSTASILLRSLTLAVSPLFMWGRIFQQAA